MIETLYKTTLPEKGKSECYVLVLTSRLASGRRVFAFMEEHGKWNNSLMRFLHEVKSVSAEEGLTGEDALKMYKSSKENLAKLGFVHSFVPDCCPTIPAAELHHESELATI
jgi:hypothetical protein